jgi:acyl-CoA reductase-like NAD-dependent aldehyde dehydrogenase
MTIDGQPAESANSFDVMNPATGIVTAQAPVCSPDQLDAAMAAAAAAFPTWRADERARSAVMVELADAIASAGEELAALLCAESGKPIRIAATEPGVCHAWLKYYAAMEIPRDVLQDDGRALIERAYRPLGVVAAITPWNFPLGLAMWKIAPALRAGNTIVLKPSPFTPLATLRMGQIMGSILPPGVLNVITGGDDLGSAMTAHSTPRKVTFTGSTAAGKKVNIAAAATLKRVTLELGGNDPAIILADVDVEKAAARLSRAAFYNAGQACALPKRIFAPRERYDEVVEAFAAVASGVVVGGPEVADATMGPLSTKPQFDRVREFVADAIDHGARVAAGGAAIEGPGYFFAPTILADITDADRIVSEEQFGPALPILAYDSVDEAIARANDTDYGLCGSAWGTDIAAAAAVAEQLEVGTTFVNTHGVLLPTVPFGGAKSSGLGVENGVAGLLAFTEAQVVHRAKV